MILLQRLHRELLALERADGLHGCLGGGEVGGVGDLLGDGGGADLDLVLAGLVGGGGVDDEVNAPVAWNLNSRNPAKLYRRSEWPNPAPG